jgi:peptide/nickel transport system permease protein
MLNYILRRIGISIILIMIISILIFFIMHIIPGDPVRVMLGMNASPESIQHFTEQWGLDRPIYIQYKMWLEGILTGDMGNSLSNGQPIAKLVKTSLPVTVSLAFFGSLMAFVIGSIVGITSAITKNKFNDLMISLFSYIGISTPAFFLGMILILIFAIKIDFFPSMGYAPFSEGLLEWFKHMFLPIITVGLINGAATGRIVRTSMIDVLSKEYIKTVRSKGLKEIVVILKHAFRNATLPVVTVIGVQFAYCLGGIVILEKVFAIPGLGRLMLSSVSHRDYPVVQVCVLLFATMLIITNLFIDIMYSYLDPRVVYD